MHQNWTEDDIESGCAAFRDVNPEGETEIARSEVSAIMSRAVDLAQARGGTMTAEDLKSRLVLVGEHAPATMVLLAMHTAAQGAEIATLRAKVAGLEANVDAAWAAAAVPVRGWVSLAEVITELKTSRDRARADLAREKSQTESLNAQLQIMNPIVRAAVDRADAAEAELQREKDRANVAEHRAAQMERRAVEAERDAEGLGSVVATLTFPSAIRPPVTPEMHAVMPIRCRLCAKTTPHRWQPSPEAGPWWRCSECSEPSPAKEFICSPTCTHDDASTPGHAERVKEASRHFAALSFREGRLSSTDSTSPPFSDAERRPTQPTRSVRLALSGGCEHDPKGGPCDTCAAPDHHCRCAGEGTCAWCDHGAADSSIKALGLHSPQQVEAWEKGAEAMRAACWEAIQPWLTLRGYEPGSSGWHEAKAAIEGAAP